MRFVGCELDDELYKRLDEVRWQERKTIADLIREAIRDRVDREPLLLVDGAQVPPAQEATQ
jgi:predicted transcriptional regulator